MRPDTIFENQREREKKRMQSDDSFKPGEETMSEDEGIARKGNADDDEFVPDEGDVLEGDHDYVPDAGDDSDFELEEVKPKKKKKKKTKAKKKKTESKTTKKKKKSTKKKKSDENDETESNVKKKKKTTKKKSTAKKKKAKLSIKEATEKMKNYLIRENRPLNAIAVYENTQRLVPKSKLTGILEDLAERPDGGIKMKK